MLSEFITRIEEISNSPKVQDLIKNLKIMLHTKGDVEIDLDDFCKFLGVKI